MRTGVTCNESRVFPVWKNSQGKPFSGPVLALYRIAVYNKGSSLYVHHLQITSSEGFKHHFTIITKFVFCDFYMKKNIACFTLMSFAVLK